MVAAVVTCLALAGGTADATTVHPDSAVKCGSKWCFFVSGVGLKVDIVSINHPHHNRFTGYPGTEPGPPA